MAKKQTFDSKLKKGQDAGGKAIKLVFSYQSPKTGYWRFVERIVRVPADGNEQQSIDAELKSSMEYLSNQA